MRNIAFLLSVLFIGLTSCQKEPDFVDPNTIRPSNSPSLLTRLVKDDGTDSTVYDFSYNSTGQLIKQVITTSDVSETRTILRDAKGMITKILSVTKDLISLQVDSSITNYYHDAATLRYTYSQSGTTTGSTGNADSLVYSYDAGGNIVSFAAYWKISSLGYDLVNRGDNTYVNGNLAMHKAYTNNGAPAGLDLSATMTYTYDTKVNPLKLKAEAVIFGFQGFEGANNVLSETYVDATNPTNNYTQTGSIIYNSNNLPVSATYSGNPADPSFVIRYYYK